MSQDKVSLDQVSKGTCVAGQSVSGSSVQRNVCSRTKCLWIKCPKEGVLQDKVSLDQVSKGRCVAGQSVVDEVLPQRIDQNIYLLYALSDTNFFLVWYNEVESLQFFSLGFFSIDTSENIFFPVSNCF